MTEETQDALAGLGSLQGKIGYIHGLHDSTNIHLNPSSSVQSRLTEYHAGSSVASADEYPKGYMLGWEEGRKQAREFLRLNSGRRPQTRSGS